MSRYIPEGLNSGYIGGTVKEVQKQVFKSGSEIRTVTISVLTKFLDKQTGEPRAMLVELQTGFGQMMETIDKSIKPGDLVVFSFTIDSTYWEPSDRWFLKLTIERLLALVGADISTVSRPVGVPPAEPQPQSEVPF